MNWLLAHIDTLRMSFLRLAGQPLATLLNVVVFGIALSLPAGFYVGLEGLAGLSRQFSSRPQVSIFMAIDADGEALEQTQQLNTKIETLITNQAALQSVGLIGRTVDISTSSGLVTGTVKSLSLSGDSPLISVQPAGSGSAVIDSVSLSQIVAVR